MYCGLHNDIELSDTLDADGHMRIEIEDYDYIRPEDVPNIIKHLETFKLNKGE